MKILLAISMICLRCQAIDWQALHQVEGSPAANQLGVTNDRGWTQISPAVWDQFARPGERWWIASDNLKVAARVMDDRRRRYKAAVLPVSGTLTYQTDFGDALLWRCPARRNHPTAKDVDFATRYANICESHGRKSKNQTKPPTNKP
jgi:hypothetical protein